MSATENKLAEIRRELERQDQQLDALEAAARAHGDVQLHIGEEIEEQLQSISVALKRRAPARAASFFVRM